MIRTALSFIALAAFAMAPVLSAQTKADPAARAKPAASATVNINTATVKDFESLPGIGTKTAERIVEYRQKNGPFKKVEELMNVRGVGEKSFLKLKPQLTLGSSKADQHPPEQR